MSETTVVPSGTVSKQQLDMIMYGRRSLYPRQFSGEKIDEEIILQLLEYANTAPNHKKTQPWRFIVFSDKSLADLVDFMREIYVSKTNKNEISQKKLDSFEERKVKTSHIVCILMHRDTMGRVSEMDEIAAVSCAVQNIYLSLNTFGIGGYWGTGNLMNDQDMHEYLSLANEELLMGFFYLGKIEVKIPAQQKDSVSSRVTWRK